MAVETTRHDIEISPITSVVVTAIAADSENGDYYREIRVFDENSAQVLTVRVRATAEDTLKIETPELTF